MLFLGGYKKIYILIQYLFCPWYIYYITEMCWAAIYIYIYIYMYIRSLTDIYISFIYTLYIYIYIWNIYDIYVYIYIYIFYISQHISVYHSGWTEPTSPSSPPSRKVHYFLVEYTSYPPSILDTNGVRQELKFQMALWHKSSLFHVQCNVNLEH